MNGEKKTRRKCSRFENYPPPPHRQQLKKDAFLTILAHQPVYSEGPSLTSITNSLRLLRDDDNNLSPM